MLFTVRKKRKSWNKTREKYMAEEKRENLAEADKGSYFNQEEWLEEFLLLKQSTQVLCKKRCS